MFEKLLVYQKAVDYADHISQLTQSFPRGLYYLTDQLNRAALSVPKNIAEGNGRFTKADRKKYFIIARGSVQDVNIDTVDQGPADSCEIFVDLFWSTLAGLVRINQVYGFH